MNDEERFWFSLVWQLVTGAAAVVYLWRAWHGA